MARYRGPSCRLCRREGMKLFLKGTKCTTPKCPFERRGYAPGQHGQSRLRLSDYGVQLREKQKVKRIYHVLERPFKFTFLKAQRIRGVTGEKLLEFLERRLDNTIYRLGWASSRKAARQLVRHRGIRVNGKILDIPSYAVRVGDTLEPSGNARLTALIQRTLEITKDRERPSWLQIPAEGVLRGAVTRLPGKSDVTLPVQEQLIVELYSK